jgi:hypothetical protein
MADAPQIPVPTPISVRSRAGTPSRRPSRAAAVRQTASVPIITGSDATPVRRISPRDSWVPSTTTASCSTRLLAMAKPGRSASDGRRTRAIAAPSTMPMTGAPTTGASFPSAVAATATPAARARPGRGLGRVVMVTVPSLAGERTRGGYGFVIRSYP